MDEPDLLRTWGSVPQLVATVETELDALGIAAQVASIASTRGERDRLGGVRAATSEASPSAGHLPEPRRTRPRRPLGSTAPARGHPCRARPRRAPATVDCPTSKWNTGAPASARQLSKSTPRTPSKPHPSPSSESSPNPSHAAAPSGCADTSWPGATAEPAPGHPNRVSGYSSVGPAVDTAAVQAGKQSFWWTRSGHADPRNVSIASISAGERPFSGVDVKGLEPMTSRV